MPLLSEERVLRWSRLDRRLAIALYAAVGKPLLLWPMLVASRLADGLLWYLLMGLLPWLDRVDGVTVTMQMLALGALNLFIYRHLKHRIGRQRPYSVCAEIRARTRALDHFSFPSGHMMHTAGFGLLLAVHYPPLAPALALFGLLVAASRIVLGLHYPSDVLAGAAIGAFTALLFIAAF